MAEDRPTLPHLLVTGTSSVERFTRPGTGGPRRRIPPRDRQEHGSALLHQLEDARRDMELLGERRQALGFDVEGGICLQFESDPDFDLKFDSLEAIRSGIELLAVREIEGRTVATVFVPDGKLERFLTKMNQYLSEETARGVPRHRDLVESIAAIHTAALEAFWTDALEVLPAPGEEAWWEVWLRRGSDPEAIHTAFQEYAPRAGLHVNAQALHFPDRTVLLARGTREQMAESAQLLNTVAELRRAKDTPQVFTSMRAVEQAEWVEEALGRTQFPGSDAPAVCLLDTGVNRGHPLLEASLRPEDMHSYHPDWNVADQHGHGTEMAGLGLYGDLMECLPSGDPIVLAHCLESVKVLPPLGQNDPELYGAITMESVARAEVAAPQRRRSVCMAVTTTDFRDRGRPSSWSAAVDQLTSGAEDNERRLLVISAGNTDPSKRHRYPDSNLANGIHDPAQAWNALTVGAFTEKDFVDPHEYPGWALVAPTGCLSPSSCTSTTWTGPWPLKPDVVLEGGNMALDPATGGADNLDSLQLLTTHRNLMQTLLTVTGETSAAAAQCARMCAMLQASYPDFWPETARALVVHSARWTPAMVEAHQPLKTRGEKERLLKVYGFGVPDLGAAMWSASNSLTLVIQDSLQPYDRVDERYRTRDMHLHAIPWPAEVLHELGETPVRMRVTLSYFVEPNPARRGWKYRHRYASHGLRFEVKTPTESVDQFRARINAAARDEEMGQLTGGDAPDWFLGPQRRGRGSLHSDWWQGTASDLAERGHIGVYPVIGWWRERPQLDRWSRLARYALIVTIETPEVEMDVYTPVVAQVEAAVPVEV
jgi:hypothetical protein